MPEQADRVRASVACLQRRSAPELDAIKSIETIHQAEVQYTSQFGRYANTLQELGPPRSGRATSSAPGLIGADLSNGVREGYKFTLTGNTAGYVITAEPRSFGSGNRQQS